jgi:catechol 2,3-dioxygenase-like lactoylglutathione lyase family enzyme
VKLAAALILTPDLDAARRFYRDVLGFEIAAERVGELVLAHDGALLQVFACDAPAPAQVHGSNAAQVLVFEVEDLEAAMADLKAKGVDFIHAEPGRNVYGRYAAFKAPGGLVHEIFQRFPA